MKAIGIRYDCQESDFYGVIQGLSLEDYNVGLPDKI